MALLTYGEEVTLVVLDHELGHQIVDVCLAADAADEECHTIDKGYGFGDLIYEIILHLESAAVVLLGPHIWWSSRRQESPHRWQSFTRTSANTMWGPYYPIPCMREYLI